RRKRAAISSASSQITGFTANALASRSVRWMQRRQALGRFIRGLRARTRYAATAGFFSFIWTTSKNERLPMSEIDTSRDFIPVKIAVLTVSDTRTFENDKSGDVLVERIE